MILSKKVLIVAVAILSGAGFLAGQASAAEKKWFGAASNDPAAAGKTSSAMATASKMNPATLKAATKMDAKTLSIMSKMDSKTLAVVSNLSKSGSLAAVAKNQKTIQALSASKAASRAAATT